MKKPFVTLEQLQEIVKQYPTPFHLYDEKGIRENARALKAEGGKITVDGPKVTYPDVKKGKVEYRTFLTSDIEYIKDDEEENQCKVSLPDQYVVFETKYFDSWEEFEAFRSLLG